MLSLHLILAMMNKNLDYTILKHRMTWASRYEMKLNHPVSIGPKFVQFSPNVTKFQWLLFGHNCWSLLECGSKCVTYSSKHFWKVERRQYLLRKGSSPLVAFLVHLETSFSGESRSLACRRQSPCFFNNFISMGWDPKSTQILLHRYAKIL